MLEQLTREVSATTAEYLRGLAQAFPEGVEPVGPGCWRVSDGKAAMEISLEPGPDRVIALLRLPTLRVSLRFVAGSAEARQAMLDWADLVMRRGGG